MADSATTPNICDDIGDLGLNRSIVVFSLLFVALILSSWITGFIILWAARISFDIANIGQCALVLVIGMAVILVVGSSIYIARWYCCLRRQITYIP